MFLKIGYTGSKQYEAKYLHFEKKINDVDPMETGEKELNKTFQHSIVPWREIHKKTMFAEIFTI